MVIVMSEIGNLVDLCRHFGSDRKYVQGAGGNISVKTTDGKLVIKSSGFRLGDVSTNKGLSTVNLPGIVEMYEPLGIEDEEKGARCLEANLISGTKPSMETSFHSHSAKYTIHLHPVHLLTLLCSLSGREEIDRLITPRNQPPVPFHEKVSWIDYAKPGHVLAMMMKEADAYRLKAPFDSGGDVRLVFLENHGIIATSKNSSTCRDSIEELEEKTVKYLARKRPDFKPFQYKNLTHANGGFLNKRPETMFFLKNTDLHGEYLFPDSVVYMKNLFRGDGRIRARDDGIFFEMGAKDAESANEVISAHIYVQQAIEKLGLSPFYLSKKQVSEIDGMPEEAYRRSIGGI